MLAPPSQAQQDTTEKEKVQSFFGFSLFYASQILNGAGALFLQHTTCIVKRASAIGKYGCAPFPF
jgi:hypothetical protein